MTHDNMFESAGRLFFRREQVKDLEQRLNAAGVNMPPDSFAGYVSINVVVISVFSTVIALAYQPASELMLGTLKAYLPSLPVIVLQLIMLVGLLAGSLAVVYITIMTLISTYLLMKTDDRRSKLESSLPDFLTLVASNIKAGMTLDQAMWYSAKPEFGLLSTEVKASIKGAFSGQSLESALDRLASRFDSKVFKRTILLLKQATATGGELTDVLERTADDVRNNLIMRKEIAASLVLYEIFVLFAAIVGTPFLFAVATRLIQVFEKISPQVGSISSSGGLFTTFSSIKVVGPVISSSDFFWFSIPTMFVTALISSFIVSVIRTGTKNQGMKYFPFVLTLSYLVYWAVNSFVTTLFSSLT